ncbi:hypothetical protein [Gordonia phthalatica]|uniref:Uncharacterized protein n=1 Tax=Gordonia phthalatica TaxID=1136941 RepID=A0A0N9N125_9ACTN|nr:hypothetical protein [Gordonia phthalatica]ALG84309.1 hypothetical protein ACH46_07090 [Gordonia phthalatica]
MDVFTGDVVWRRPGLRSTEDMHIMRSKEVEYRLLDVPDDRLSVSMTDLATGDEAWRFTTPRLCSIGGVQDRRHAVFAIVNCADQQSRLVAIDPTTGAATTVAEDRQGMLAGRVERDADAGADGVKYSGEYLLDVGESLVDARSQKPIKGFHGALCDGAGECLVPSSGGKSVVLRSLTGSHPDVVFRGVGEAGNPVVLRESVVWVVGGDNGRTVVIGD